MTFVPMTLLLSPAWSPVLGCTGVGLGKHAFSASQATLMTQRYQSIPTALEALREAVRRF